MVGKKNIVVLGMHRSGTSMFAEILSRLGFYAGETEELLEPQLDNPKGFWERRDVVQLNDLILKEAGGSWFNPPIPTYEKDYTNTMTSILDALSSGGSRWLIKDPRLLLTWPLWKEVLKNAVPIVVYRSPLNVARSLKNRHGFPLTFGLDLWEYYNHKYIATFRNPRTSLFVSYDRFIRDPEHEMKMLCRRLVELSVLEQSDIDLTLAIAAFSPSLINSANAKKESDKEIMTPTQISLENYLNHFSEKIDQAKIDNHELIPRDTALKIRIKDFSQALTPLSEALENHQRLHETVMERDLVVRERDQVLSQLKSQETSYEKLIKAHESEKEKHSNLLSHYKELERDHKDLASAHHSHKKVHESLEIEYESLNEEHQNLSNAHHAEVKTRKNIEEKYSYLEEKSSYLEEKSSYLFNELTDIYRNLLLYETSFQARLDRAVNSFYRFVSLQRGRSTSYLEVIKRADQHFKEFDFEVPHPPPRRLELIARIVRYIILHPASSIRSVSLHRLRKFFSMLFLIDSKNLATWIQARFPADRESPQALGLSIDDQKIDDLHLQFDTQSEPEVTIVIPVHNQYRTTMVCLNSILQNTKEVLYEIILADDYSNDLTKTIEERIKGIRVVRHETNIGFLQNCNSAAREAKGSFLVFLNNDTSVESGWLAELLETLKNDSSAGMVGPQLLFPDGRLQEAGGIVWKDGSGWNYGRGESPQLSQFNYRKEVDYISGACLLLRKNLWDTLGGFDERFSPAYYEDTDLAFAIRQAGLKVIYQPKSKVIHFEGVSNGKDLNTGIKKYQLRNKEIFRQKWASELEANHYEHGENINYARERGGKKRTVLVIDHYVPHFDKDAGGRSTYQYILLLLELEYKVIFLGANFFPHQPYTDILQRRGVEVIFGEDVARDIKTWFKVNVTHIDIVYIHRPHVAEQFMGIIEKLTPKPLVIYFGHDLHYLRTEREAVVKRSKNLEKEAAAWKKREQAIFERVDIVYYPSAAEIEEVRSKNPLIRTRAIPLYALASEKMPLYNFDSRSGLLFVGGFNHPPNVDAMIWFVHEILPHVLAEIPDITLYIVGSNAPQSVQLLDGPNVEVLGFLSDEELAIKFSSIKIAVVPLRFGAGVKGKVIESVQQNVPIISTSIGVEGIPEWDQVIEVSDEAEEFAKKLIQLYKNPLKSKNLMDKYPRWLMSHFGKEVAKEILLEDFGPPEKNTVLAPN